MKRFAAVLVMLAMVIFAGGALAQAAFDGDWVQLDGGLLEMLVPSDWDVYINEPDPMGDGLYCVYLAASPEMNEQGDLWAAYVQVLWCTDEDYAAIEEMELEGDLTLESIQNLAREQGYADAEILEINGVRFVCDTSHSDWEFLNMITIDEEKQEVYVFQIYPCDEGPYLDINEGIARSIRYIGK